MLETYSVALIPLIIGLVEVLKIARVPKRWLPVASLLFGLAASIFYLYPGSLKDGIIVGLMLGLSASGLYSGGKNMMDKNDYKR